MTIDLKKGLWKSLSKLATPQKFQIYDILSIRNFKYNDRFYLKSSLSIYVNYLLFQNSIAFNLQKQ